MRLGRKYERTNREDLVRTFEHYLGYSRFIVAIGSGRHWEVFLEDDCFPMFEAARAVASAMSNLPPFILSALPPRMVLQFRPNYTTGSYNQWNAAREHRITMPSTMVETIFATDISVGINFAFQESMLHEVTHVFDHEHGLSGREDCQAAAIADGKHVSRYAATDDLEHRGMHLIQVSTVSCGGSPVDCCGC